VDNDGDFGALHLEIINSTILQNQSDKKSGRSALHSLYQPLYTALGQKQGAMHFLP
jgi:hypothetical protein